MVPTTTINVSAYTDAGLRAAISTAIADSADNTQVEIDFTAGPGTILLTGGVLDLSEGSGTGLITINATNQNITVNAQGNSGVFDVPGVTTVYGVSPSGAQVAINSLTIEGARYSAANGAGDGIINYGSLTITNSTLSGNSGYYGGIGNFNTMIVNNSAFSANTTIFGTGGGISNGGTLVVNDSTFSGNFGSGIYNSATLTVTNSTFSSNSNGGIYNASTATLSNCTLSSNSVNVGNGIVPGYGGAPYTIPGQCR